MRKDSPDLTNVTWFASPTTSSPPTCSRNRPRYGRTTWKLEQTVSGPCPRRAPTHRRSSTQPTERSGDGSVIPVRPFYRGIRADRLSGGLLKTLQEPRAPTLDPCRSPVRRSSTGRLQPVYVLAGQTPLFGIVETVFWLYLAARLAVSLLQETSSDACQCAQSQKPPAAYASSPPLGFLFLTRRHPIRATVKPGRHRFRGVSETFARCNTESPPDEKGAVTLNGPSLWISSATPRRRWSRSIQQR